MSDEIIMSVTIRQLKSSHRECLEEGIKLDVEDEFGVLDAIVKSESEDDETCLERFMIPKITSFERAYGDHMSTNSKESPFECEICHKTFKLKRERKAQLVLSLHHHHHPQMFSPLPDIDDGKDRSALFAEINQGEGITRSLKKVTSDMQTHKNPTLRQGPTPFVKANMSEKPSITKVAIKESEPVFKRDGKKWIIEHQKNNSTLKVQDVEMNNVVYMFKCENSTLVVNGKLNSIVMDSCKKCSLVFDSVVSSCEFVNCQSVKMQVLGTVPTISIDKTDGCQMFLGSQSADTVQIVSAKSSEMNVVLLDHVSDRDGDMVELPIPEQFITLISGKTLKTTPIENRG
ncbi:adenylyl cyclase-associated protein 1-like [Ctenocephalides felis]|uniref:adenylyl cyclase-associated protein 1-like n=1 Tax=Ctenocephalides felis TaxID=7515 RepID=UPI000E6E1828|nr:adenylyl cyclase-associated protein 1-like [Ctenocephalides felis]